MSEELNTGEEIAEDADLQEEIIDDQFEEEVTEEEIINEQEVDDLPPLNEKEKTAFEKRLERDKGKLEEKIRADMEEQFKQKYSKHDEVIASMGGDPDRILSAAKEAALVREANKLADERGWDEDQTQWYIEDQKNKKELKELRVQMQINNLKDNPDYAGISSMEKDILSMIDKSNGALNAEQAYWAMGGSKKAAQIKLETEQREIIKRGQQSRTVLKDAPNNTSGEKPLSPQVLQEAKRMGITEAEARKLMNKQPVKDIDEFRERQKQSK